MLSGGRLDFKRSRKAPKGHGEYWFLNLGLGLPRMSCVTAKIYKMRRKRVSSYLRYFCKDPVDTNFEDLTLGLVLASTKDMLTCAAPQSQGVTSLDDGFLSIEAAKNVAFYLCRSDHGEH